MMHKFSGGLAVLLMMVGVGVHAQTPTAREAREGQQGRQSRNGMACILMSADDQSQQLKVWGFQKPQGSSFAGNEQGQADLQEYTIQVKDDTIIHWQGSDDRITTSQLKEMCKDGQPRNVRFAVYYDDNIANNSLTAKEIVLFRSQQQRARDEERHNGRQ